MKKSELNMKLNTSFYNNLFLQVGKIITNIVHLFECLKIEYFYLRTCRELFFQRLNVFWLPLRIPMFCSILIFTHSIAKFSIQISNILFFCENCYWIKKVMYELKSNFEIIYKSSVQNLSGENWGVFQTNLNLPLKNWHYTPQAQNEVTKMRPSNIKVPPAQCPFC